jgi:hypothetical protein
MRLSFENAIGSDAQIMLVGGNILAGMVLKTVGFGSGWSVMISRLGEHWTINGNAIVAVHFKESEQ